VGALLVGDVAGRPVAEHVGAAGPRGEVLVAGRRDLIRSTNDGSAPSWPTDKIPRRPPVELASGEQVTVGDRDAEWPKGR
jgi:hypothetical protein